ncbi:unnamed protein product [Linum trigynum]|uniref:Uncharacterized protein n=1 Tax=Linum trigynum TaxID=586398 RepID=A0AAV2DG64_9ROSI
MIEGDREVVEGGVVTKEEKQMMAERAKISKNWRRVPGYADIEICSSRGIRVVVVEGLPLERSFKSGAEGLVWILGGISGWRREEVKGSLARKSSIKMQERLEVFYLFSGFSLFLFFYLL